MKTFKYIIIIINFQTKKKVEGSKRLLPTGSTPSSFSQERVYFGEYGCCVGSRISDSFCLAGTYSHPVLVLCKQFLNAAARWREICSLVQFSFTKRKVIKAFNITQFCLQRVYVLFNRPGVAGAVL